MPRSQGSEAEKEEVPDNHLHFLELPVQADDDVRAPEALLGVLQQLDEGLLGALAQLLHRHVDVESALPQDRLPRRQPRRVVAARHAELEPLHQRFAAAAAAAADLDAAAAVLVARTALVVGVGGQKGVGAVVVLGVQSIALGVRGIP